MRVKRQQLTVPVFVLYHYNTLYTEIELMWWDQWRFQEIHESGATTACQNWFDAPKHVPYVFIVRAENKIDIVNITTWLNPCSAVKINKHKPQKIQKGGTRPVRRSLIHDWEQLPFNRTQPSTMWWNPSNRNLKELRQAPCDKSQLITTQKNYVNYEKKNIRQRHTIYGITKLSFTKKLGSNYLYNLVFTWMFLYRYTTTKN